MRTRFKGTEFLPLAIERADNNIEEPFRLVVSICGFVRDRIVWGRKNALERTRGYLEPGSMASDVSVHEIIITKPGGAMRVGPLIFYGTNPKPEGNRNYRQIKNDCE